MIVDTSALIAIAKREDAGDQLLRTIYTEPGLLPAPALVEFVRVAAGARFPDPAAAHIMLADVLEGPLQLLTFTPEHAGAAAAANAVHGAGNGKGGTLNLLDLMVYGCAKVENLPILCTGLDFAATDAAIHPASRRS